MRRWENSITMYRTKTERVLGSTGLKYDPTLSLHESDKEPSGFKKGRIIPSWVTTKFPTQILHHVICNHSRSKYCEQRLLASSCLPICLCLSACMYVWMHGWPSIRLPVWHTLAPNERSFVKFDVWVLFESLSRKFKFHFNNNNIYLLQLGCHPVAVVILHVNQTWNWLLLNLSLEGYMRSM